MSSDSDEHSSSPHKEHKRREEGRSRSRDRRHYDKNESRDRKVRFKIPELTGPLLNFKTFSLSQTDRISSELMQKGYQKYKREWQNKQNDDFMTQYKKDAWFSEKYDPEVLDLLERDRRENNRKNFNEFIGKLRSGFYDKIDLRVKDPAQLGVQAEVQEEDYPKSDRLYIISQTVEIHMNTNLDIIKEPIFGFDPDACALFLKAVPRAISRYDIRAAVENLEGYKNLTMSDPVKKMNLTRYCWVEFQNEELCNRAALSMSGLMIKNESLNVSKSQTKIKRVKILKNYPINRVQTDLQNLQRLIQKMDEQCGITGNDLLIGSFSHPEHKFDLCLLYLRKVHAYDYFTSAMYENQRILSLKVGSAFLRINSEQEETPAIAVAFKRIEELSQKRVQLGHGIPQYMGMVRDQIERFIRQTQKLTKDQNLDIWTCNLCSKKFKSCEFLAKHIVAKHEDIKFKKIQVITEQLYLKDSNKITFTSLNDKNFKSRKAFVGGFQRERRRQVYKDFDEPEGEKTQRVVIKPMINFLDI